MNAWLTETVLLYAHLFGRETPGETHVVIALCVLPLTVLFQKGGYVTELIAWTVTLLTVGAVLTLEPFIRSKADAFMLRIERLHREPGRSP